jgi:hypothetical protein
MTASLMPGGLLNGNTEMMNKPRVVAVKTPLLLLDFFLPGFTNFQVPSFNL